MTGIRITARARQLFKKMERRETTQQEWQDLHDELHKELKCKPWDYPCIQSPEHAKVNTPHPAARAIYNALKAAKC